MKIPRPAMLVAGLFGAGIAALLLIGAPRHTERAGLSPSAPAAGPAPASVSADGLTLRSVDIALPDDVGTYPDGPHADIINANCTACHSASMALYQPRLSAAEWRKEVEKMRETFGAPVAEADVPAIVAYLTAMSARLPGPEAAP